MHSSSRLEASLRNSRGKSPCISYGAKSLPPTVCGKLREPIYKTVSLCTLTQKLLHSSRQTQMLSPKHNCYLLYNRCAYSGCHFWLSFITVVIQAHTSLLPEHQVVRNLMYTPHAACGYCIKLQRQQYTKQSMTENNNNNIIYIIIYCNRTH